MNNYTKNQNAIDEFLEKYTSPEDDFLKKVNRQTYVKTLHPRMISGAFQGKFLKMICQMISPDRILEIGTFTGYSAIAMSMGLKENGRIDSLEINEEFAEIAQNNIIEAGLNDKIKVITGNAIESMKTLKKEYDLVFIDGEKSQYPEYYENAFELIKLNGWMLIDNIFWDGKMFEAEKHKDKQTQGIHKLVNLVADDKRVENQVLPLRDGLMLIRKISD